MKQNNTALITGASGGIGLALAKIHAQKGGDLVIVARSEDKLLQIKSELESTYGINVTVTALCPGTVNTGFVAAGDLSGVDAWKNAKSPESVAKIAYSDMEKGKLLSFNQASLKFMLTWVIPFLPRKTVLKMSRQSMEKKK